MTRSEIWTQLWILHWGMTHWAVANHPNHNTKPPTAQWLTPWRRRLRHCHPPHCLWGSHWGKKKWTGRSIIQLASFHAHLWRQLLPYLWRKTKVLDLHNPLFDTIHISPLRVIPFIVPIWIQWHLDLVPKYWFFNMMPLLVMSIWLQWLFCLFMSMLLLRGDIYIKIGILLIEWCLPFLFHFKLRNLFFYNCVHWSLVSFLHPYPLLRPQDRLCHHAKLCQRIYPKCDVEDLQNSYKDDGAISIFGTSVT